ncbi:MAG: EamA family transporter [Pseudomonadota bacterium]
MLRTGTMAALALALLAFAGNSLLTRAALDGGLIGAGSFSLIRLASGAVLLGGMMLAAKRNPLPSRQDLGGVVALLIYALGFSFAYLELGAGLGALLLFGCVQATTISAGFLLRERFDIRSVAGLALAGGGLVFLLRPGETAPPIAAALMMMAAGSAWGAYTLLGRGAPEATLRTARNFIGAAVLASPLLLLHDGASLTANGALLAILSGAITSGLGYAVWYAVLPRLSAVTAGSAQLVVPPLTALLALPLLKEPLTMDLVIASTVILGGVALTFRRA